MRVRAAAFVLLALAAAGCSGKHYTNRASLSVLNDLSAKQNNYGVILDGETGKALAAFRVNNPIRAAIPDGNGGWYIGGGFIYVNGQLRKRLAHIRSGGTLDPDWRPEVNGNGVSVSSLARIDSRLYVAGDFAELNHRSRVHLGAFDVRTGRLDGWRPAQKRPYWYDVLLAANDRLLVGGGACCADTALVALDAKTGALDPSWHVRVDASALEGAGVRMLARDGPNVIVSGVIRSIDGRPGSLAKVDAATGRLDRGWRPAGGCCQLLALATGGGVYGSINGPGRYPVVAFDGRTGELDPNWHATVAAATDFYGAASANALAVAGSRVYVAGDFDTVNGRHRVGLAALDPNTARVLPNWTPRANTVYATFLAASGSNLLVGLGLSREVRFDFTGLKTFVPVRRLHLTLALSAAGTVRVGIGRHCDLERWTETGRCEGHVFRWIGSVRFARAQRKRYEHNLGIPSGRYFVRFEPHASGGAPRPPYDFPITVPPPKLRSTFGG
jgi:hypothetical protein